MWPGGGEPSCKPRCLAPAASPRRRPFSPLAVHSDQTHRQRLPPKAFTALLEATGSRPREANLPRMDAAYADVILVSVSFLGGPASNLAKPLRRSPVTSASSPRASPNAVGDWPCSTCGRSLGCARRGPVLPLLPRCGDRVAFKTPSFAMAWPPEICSGPPVYLARSNATVDLPHPSPRVRRILPDEQPQCPSFRYFLWHHTS